MRIRVYYAVLGSLLALIACHSDKREAEEPSSAEATQGGDDPMNDTPDGTIGPNVQEGAAPGEGLGPGSVGPPDIVGGEGGVGGGAGIGGGGIGGAGVGGEGGAGGMLEQGR